MKCDSCGMLITNNQTAIFRLTANGETFKTVSICWKCERTLSIVFDKHSEVKDDSIL
jgi:RNase P subunit RPR2